MIEAIKQVWFVLREEPMYIIPVMLSCVWGLYLIYFSIYTFERLWSRILGATVMSLVIIFLVMACFLRNLLTKIFNKERKTFPLRLKIAESPHLKHNRQDCSGQQKMPGPALMG